MIPIQSFALIGGAEELTVRDDGQVAYGKTLFGVLSPDGRFVDAEGNLVAKLADDGRIRGPGGAPLGRIEADGSVTSDAGTVLAFGEGGRVSGLVVTDLPVPIRLRGPKRVRVAAAVVLVGIGQVAEFASAMSAGTQAAEPALTQAANEFCAALAGADREGLERAIITHAELSAVSRKAPGKDRYDRMVTKWIDARIREFSKRNDISCSRTEIVKRLVQPAGEKLYRAQSIASVKAVFRWDAKEHPMLFPLLFIDVNGVWKVSIRN
ncbi:MAG: hypothetical protein MJE77_47165 [Proteobacteria bacterium]|nr:hypothetical protein [Pseudomonadota bacterium]